MPNLKQTLRFWPELLVKTGNPVLASKLLAAGVWPFHLKAGRVEPLDLSIETACQWPWLLENLNGAAKLKKQSGATYSEYAGNFVMEIDGVKLVATSGEELFTAEEVFVKNVYRFIPGENIVVLDIGMNVGYSSLHFAARPDVVAVRGFEPFPRTYEQALKSFELNPGCAAKIRAQNAGVAGGNREVEAAYDPSYKGASGMYGKAAATERIRLRDANEVLDEILLAHPGHPIVAKIDCEGAEYEIIEAWAASRRLEKLTLLMIEWHRLADGHDPVRLEKALGEAGFGLIAEGDLTGETGMIYATRP